MILADLSRKWVSNSLSTAVSRFFSITSGDAVMASRADMNSVLTTAPTTLYSSSAKVWPFFLYTMSGRVPLELDSDRQWIDTFGYMAVSAMFTGWRKYRAAARTTSA